MLKLTDGTARQLMALRRSPAYEALRDVMEALCQVGETELLQLDRSAGATDSQVLSAQDQARAARAYFEKVQMEIEEQIAAHYTPVSEEDLRNLHSSANSDSDLGPLTGAEGEAHGEGQPGN